MTAMALRERFVAAAVAANSRVHRLGGWEQVAELARELAGSGQVAVSASLAEQAPELMTVLGPDAMVAGGHDPVAQVASVAVGVTAGELAVAETGSVLVSEHELADRAVSMLAPTLIQVVAGDRLVAGLEDVARWLESRVPSAGYVALITGPSRSADIERSLTIGVQGPAEVHVVMLG